MATVGVRQPASVWLLHVSGRVEGGACFGISISGHNEERLSAKILEIDMRDGQRDGKMSPRPARCPKCEAMMSPRFGRCLFCGEASASGPAL